MDAQFLEEEFRKVETALQTVTCTCMNPRPSSYIFCPFEKNGDFKYTVVDVTKLQTTFQKPFDQLSSIYAALVMQPNKWFSRPQAAEFCCHKAAKKASSFLNALSSECRVAFQDKQAQCALKDLRDGKWPNHEAFIIGKKQVGHCQYTFIYYKPIPLL
jgi:hypothetical protein